MTDGKANGEKKTEHGRLGGLSGFHIDGARTNRGLSIAVGGIIGISDYNESEVVLLSHGGRVTLKGRRLKLCVYEDNTVEVNGRIEEIAFSYGKN